MHSLSSVEMLKHLRARRFLTAKTNLLSFEQTIGYLDYPDISAGEMML